MDEPRQQSGNAMATSRLSLLRAVVTRVVLFTFIWWLLSGGGPKAWSVGAVVILAALIVSLRLLPAGPHHVSLFGLFAFTVFFIVQSVKAGVQVARIALRPRLDLRPVMVEFSSRLQDESARVFLASTLSLLPGTLSAGLEGRMLRMHVLDERMPAEEEFREVERRVARVFCTELS